MDRARERNLRLNAEKIKLKRKSRTLVIYSHAKDSMWTRRKSKQSRKCLNQRTPKLYRDCLARWTIWQSWSYICQIYSSPSDDSWTRILRGVEHTPAGFWSHDESSHEHPGTPVLCRQETGVHPVRCVRRRSWSRVVAGRTPSSVSISCTYCHWKKLCANREGATRYRICLREVWSICVWKREGACADRS